MHRLLEESKRIKVQADRILKESGIIEILKDYGEIKIGGSYHLDVMLRPDLDFFVVREKHDYEKLINIVSKLIASKYFYEVNTVNQLDLKTSEWQVNLKGFYLAVKCEIDGVIWKIDIWLISPEYDKTTELTEHFMKLLQQEIDDLKRIAILEIKDAMRQGEKYIKGVDGGLIYGAVLESGVSDVEDFKKFLQSRK